MTLLCTSVFSHRRLDLRRRKSINQHHCVTNNALHSALLTHFLLPLFSASVSSATTTGPADVVSAGRSSRRPFSASYRADHVTKPLLNCSSSRIRCSTSLCHIQQYTYALIYNCRGWTLSEFRIFSQLFYFLFIIKSYSK